MSPEPALLFTMHDDLPQEDHRIVDAGLTAHNDASAPLHEVRPLACFARLDTGQVIGGGVGRTWGLCCELQQLWVQPAHRGRGIGARLVQEFERRALQRGCRTIYLETFSFQAPVFYQELGYQVRLELHGYAEAISKYIMVRELREEPRTTSDSLAASPSQFTSVVKS